MTALLATGGPLAIPPDRLRTLLTDDVLLADVAQEYRHSASGVAVDGHAVIITAGPPGAGKSSAIDAMITGYRRIDSDEIKDLLLGRADAAKLLDDRHRYTLCDGGPVLPGELAGWVHRASTDIADLVRAESLRLGENVVIEGTLAWDGLVRQYPTELADFDYEDLTIVNVEVSRSVAAEQARSRWWLGRQGGSAVGGRFLPDAALALFYPSTDAISVCATRARELYSAARHVGVETQLAFVSRDASGTERSALITDAGVQAWPGSFPGRAPKLGVVCIRCGRPLTAPESVARGTGSECAHL